MRKQAWNYKSQIVPKNESKGNNQRENIEYINCKGIPENILGYMMYMLYSAITIKTNKTIQPAGIVLNDENFDITKVEAFSTDLSQKMTLDPEGLVTLKYMYDQLFQQELGSDIYVDSLPRLTEEEFYSLA